MPRALSAILADLSTKLAEGEITSTLDPALVRQSAAALTEGLAAVADALAAIDAVQAGEIQDAVSIAMQECGELGDKLATEEQRITALSANVADLAQRVESMRDLLAAAAAQAGQQ